MFLYYGLIFLQDTLGWIKYDFYATFNSKIHSFKDLIYKSAFL